MQRQLFPTDLINNAAVPWRTLSELQLEDASHCLLVNVSLGKDVGYYGGPQGQIALQSVATLPLGEKSCTVRAPLDASPQIPWSSVIAFFVLEVCVFSCLYCNIAVYIFVCYSMLLHLQHVPFLFCILPCESKCCSSFLLMEVFWAIAARLSLSASM